MFGNHCVKRIDPFQGWKTSKISIGGSNYAAMLEGKGRNMRIRNQVGDGLSIIEHPLERDPMLLSGPNNSCTWLIKPALYAP